MPGSRLSRPEVMTRMLSADSALKTMMRRKLVSEAEADASAQECTPLEAERLLKEKDFWNFSQHELKALQVRAKQDPDAVYADKSIELPARKETRAWVRATAMNMEPDEALDCLCTGMLVDKDGKFHYLSPVLRQELQARANNQLSWSPLFKPQDAQDDDQDQDDHVIKPVVKRAKAQVPDPLPLEQCDQPMELDDADTVLLEQGEDDFLTDAQVAQVLMDLAKCGEQ